MPTPWDILGLAADQRDQRSIKRAYAKLLKQHRPDQDPDGFRRLHDAYQWALRMADEEDDDEAEAVRPSLPLVMPSLRVQPTVVPTTGSATAAEPSAEPAAGDRAVVATVTSDADAEPTPSEHPTPAPASTDAAIVPTSPTARPAPGDSEPSVQRVPAATPWDLALAHLESAAGQPPGPLRSQALTASFRRMAKLVTTGHGTSTSLMELLNRHLPDGVHGWCHIFTDDDLLDELRSGGSDLTANTLKGCFDASDWDRLTGFAQRWLSEGDSPDFNHREAIIITRALAVWIAMVDYPLAQHLLQQFPAQVLRSVDEELDQVMTLGRDARELPVGARRYLCDVIRGKDARDADAIRDRAQLLAYVTRIPADSLLGRLLHQRMPGYITPPQPQRGTEVPLNLLSLLLAAIAVSLFTLGIWIATSLGARDGIISLVVVGLIVAVIGGGIWTYRACAPHYFRVVRPWLWERLGPFDVPCKLLLVWSVVGVAIPALVHINASGLTTLIVVCSFPLMLLVIRWGRLALAIAMTGVPAWAMTGQRLRLMFNRCIAPGTGEVKSTGVLHLLWCGVVAMPAMIMAALLIIGLATCPSWAPTTAPMQIAAILVWSAPWVIAALVVHAILRQWWADGGRWWKPVTVLGWCCWLPAAPWMATMFMMWTGQAQEPAGITTGISALLVAALLPMTVLPRLRRITRTD